MNLEKSIPEAIFEQPEEFAIEETPQVSEVKKRPEKVKETNFLRFGRKALVGLTFLFLQNALQSDSIQAEETSAGEIYFALGETNLTLSEFDQMEVSGTPIHIEPKSKELKILLEDDTPSYRDSEAWENGPKWKAVADPVAFQEWVKGELVKDKDLLEENGIDMDSLGSLNPKDFAKIAVIVVDKAFDYDQETADAINQERANPALAASQPGSLTPERPIADNVKISDRTPVDTLLMRGSNHVVCRHFAEATKQVFAVLKSNYPEQLRNSYLQTVRAEDNKHAWDVLVDVSSPRTAALSFIDPTSVDGLGLDAIGNVVGGKMENIFRQGREDGEVRYYYELFKQGLRPSLKKAEELEKSFMKRNDTTVLEDLNFLVPYFSFSKEKSDDTLMSKLVLELVDTPLVVQMSAADNRFGAHQEDKERGGKQELIRLYKRIVSECSWSDDGFLKDNREVATKSIHHLLNLLESPEEKAGYIKVLQGLDGEIKGAPMPKAPKVEVGDYF